MSAVTSALTDTWRGLVQRRLWPVALLLVAAAIAVPVVLRAEPEPEPVQPARDAVAARSAELAAQPIVAAASSSERETVRRVLGARKDPFRPTNQPKQKKPEVGSAVARDAAAAKTQRSSTFSGSGGSTPAASVPSTGSDAAPETAKPRHAAYSLTVRWGSSDADELERMNVKRLRALPDADEPVVIYLGLLRNDPKTAVFMVDAGATAVGDGRCQPDPANCETIELRQGETEFFDVEGESGRVQQYQLDLVKIHAKQSGDATSARTAGAAKAKGGRRTLRSPAAKSSLYRLDAATGLLERRDDDA